ncbi:hypothetical protein DFAR_3320010 [Desulfarculales bacterium]
MEQTLERLRQANLDIVKALAGAIEAKDLYTRGHADRVCQLPLAMAQVGERPNQTGCCWNTSPCCMMRTR